MARRTRVLLYSSGDHTLAMVGVDAVVWILAYNIADALYDLSTALICLGVAVLVSGVQRAMVAVEFDDTAITLVRPWRWRRRIKWSRVAGLMYSSTESLSKYRLHLVLKGHQPPPDMYFLEREVRHLAKEPVIMHVHREQVDEERWETRAARCHKRIGAELARHGFPLPPLVPWVYRSPEYTDEEVADGMRAARHGRPYRRYKRVRSPMSRWRRRK